MMTLEQRNFLIVEVESALPAVIDYPKRIIAVKVYLHDRKDPVVLVYKKQVMEKCIIGWEFDFIEND